MIVWHLCVKDSKRHSIASSVIRYKHVQKHRVDAQCLLGYDGQVPDLFLWSKHCQCGEKMLHLNKIRTNQSIVNVVIIKIVDDIKLVFGNWISVVLLMMVLISVVDRSGWWTRYASRWWVWWQWRQGGNAAWITWTCKCTASSTRDATDANYPLVTIVGYIALTCMSCRWWWLSSWW